MIEKSDERNHQEGHTGPSPLHRLREALDRITKAKPSTHEPVTCGICHEGITLESKGVCADENGHIAHTDCYVQKVIDSTKRPVAPERGRLE